jgi:hypothetical protein
MTAGLNTFVLAGFLYLSGNLAMLLATRSHWQLFVLAMTLINWLSHT